jgi:hypothetical protein
VKTALSIAVMLPLSVACGMLIGLLVALFLVVMPMTVVDAGLGTRMLTQELADRIVFYSGCIFSLGIWIGAIAMLLAKHRDERAALNGRASE